MIESASTTMPSNNVVTDTDDSSIAEQPVDISVEDDKEQLFDILTSSDYSDVNEITVPKAQDDTWLTEFFERFFEWLFGGNDSSDTSSLPEDWYYVLSLMFKVLAILALLVFIYWVFKNSDSILEWFGKRSWKLDKRQIVIDDYRQSHLAQGWESLPPHEQVPIVVKQLLAEDEILPASSILYRASLRWLNDVHSFNIRPTNTELQCINLIQRVGESQSLALDTSEFIINVIRQWIPVAYSGLYDTESNRHQRVSENVCDNPKINNHQNMIHTLQTSADSWLLHLPTAVKKTKHQLASKDQEISSSSIDERSVV